VPLKTKLGRAVAFFGVLAVATPSVARADTVTACMQAADKGQAAKRQGRLLDARDAFLVCARDACPGVIRADCARWLDEVEVRIPAASVRVQTDDGRDVAARLFVDGTEIPNWSPGRTMRMEPGTHTFRAEAEGFEPAEETAVLAEGEKARLLTLVVARPKNVLGPTSPLPPEEDARSSRPPMLVYPLAGIGVAGLAGFTIFGLSGRAEADDLREGCGRTRSCTEADVSSARSMYLVADVALAVGVVALGTAAVLWLTSR